MNPLNQLAQQSGLTREQLSEKTGLGINTLDATARPVSPRREPEGRMSTFRQFAGALGYRVVLRFEPVEGERE